MIVPPLKQIHLDVLRDVIRARCGLLFPSSRLHDLAAGARHVMENMRISEPDRFIQQIEADNRIFDAFVAHVVVTETYFFREPEQFDVLRTQVLPDLRKRLVDAERIRIWSAGCATGEEPYSIAILLEQEGLADVADILATDISVPALERAKKASYGAWSLRDDAQGIASKYFTRHQDKFLLREHLRNRVNFKKLNLAADVYPGVTIGVAEMDLILCRNVLIYFDRETISRVAQQLLGALKTGGWLLTGPSDPPLWDHAPCQTYLTPGGILYRRAATREQKYQFPATANSPVHDENWRSRSESAAPSAQSLMPVSLAFGMAPSEGTDKRRHQVEESNDPDLSDVIRQIHDIADRGSPLRAEAMASTALRLHPLSSALHFIHAVILTELARYDDAVTSLRRVIYLDPDLVLPHFVLGSVLQRQGKTADAYRTYQNVLTLCHGRPTDELVLLSQGERIASLMEATTAQLGQMVSTMGRAQ